MSLPPSQPAHDLGVTAVLSITSFPTQPPVSETGMTGTCHICQVGAAWPADHRAACGHSFHYECLYQWYDSLRRNGVKQPRRCPLCGADSGYLPLREGFVVREGINCCPPHYLEDIGYGLYNHCTAVIRSRESRRQGTVCGLPCQNQRFCLRHRQRSK